jgi:hypothetical protein
MQEFLKVRNCKYLLSLSKMELKSIVYDSSEYSKEGNTYSWEVYHSQIIKYLKLVISQNGEMPMTYKFARNRTEGRQYSSDFGIQNLQHKIRTFIIDDRYSDYDMSNAHPKIMLYLANLHNINVPQLKMYCYSRKETLEKYNLTKREVLVALNSDNMRTKNTWLKLFLLENKECKERLLTFYPDLTTDNKKNPLSSKINFLLCKIENEIIQLVINSLKTDQFTKMFDGILSIEKLDVNILNDITKKFDVEWVEKKHANEIFIPENWKDPELILEQEIKDSNLMYAKLKLEFEKENCFVRSPLCYVSLIGGEYILYSHEKFKILHQASPLVKNDENKYIRFITKWLLDEKKRTYDLFEFEPYNKEGPSKCTNKFNKFVPFSFTKEYVEPDMDFIDKYVNTLIYNLCGGEKDAYQYLLKYIASLIQFPSLQCEQAVVMLGKEGVGKDQLTFLIECMLDNQNYSTKTSDVDLLFGSFNSEAEHKIMIQLNEASNSSAVEYLEKFKDKTTAKYILINPKGVTPYKTKNCMRLFIASNNKKPVILSENDRRFFVIKSTNVLLQDIVFFKAFTDGLNDRDIVGGIFHYFNNMDLEGFNTRTIPKTEIKKSMILENRPPLICFLQDFLDTIDPPSCVYTKDHNWFLKKTDFRKKYIKYLGDSGLSVIGATASKFNRDVLEFKSIIEVRCRLSGSGNPQNCYEISRIGLYNLLETEYPTTKIKEMDSSGFSQGFLIEDDE